MKKTIILTLLSLLSLVSISSYAYKPTIAERYYPCQQEERKRGVLKVLKEMKDKYPEAQYRDVYKNFMQDYFGPGHLLSDTTAASRFLRKELDSAEQFDGPDFEPTGYNGNFYRVNLSLVKDSVIPYDSYFSAFFRSVSTIEPPAAEDWKQEWEAIDEIMKENGFSYPDEEADRKEIMDLLANNKFIVHHSKRFNEAYHQHYRIVSKDIFADEIYPLIDKARQKKARR